jgi:beta-lactamase class A
MKLGAYLMRHGRWLGFAMAAVGGTWHAGSAVAQAPGTGHVYRNSAAIRDFEQQITLLGQSFAGDIGIAVQDVDTGAVVQFDGYTFFPQQSVSKLWVALAALDAADRGVVDLSSPAVLREADLTLFHQPIARQIRAKGSYATTLDALMTRALQQSDNTCNDFLLRAIGGPEAVRAFLAARNIVGVRFGPGERLMQSRLAGLTWRQEYASGNAFYQARGKVPLAQRRAAFDDYVANPVDGALPTAIVGALARLQRGELLSAVSSRRLLDTMSHTRTGPLRLKGGLSPGWTLAHKTGTGQQIGGMQTGYNDIGIITSPAGRSYAVAVMIRRTSAPIPARMAVMQNVVRAVIAFDATKSRLPLDGGVTTARKR